MASRSKERTRAERLLEETKQRVILDAGLALLAKLDRGGALDSYYLFHAARADLLRRKGDCEAALDAYRRALSLATNAVERRYLLRRLEEIGRATSAP